MENNDIIICIECLGTGFEEHEEFDRGDWQVNLIPCTTCEGSGRLKVALTYKPYKPYNPIKLNKKRG